MRRHITMFCKVNGKDVRCTISDEFKSDFESLGFVDSGDKLAEISSPKKRGRPKKDDNNKG